MTPLLGQVKGPIPSRTTRSISQVSPALALCLGGNLGFVVPRRILIAKPGLDGHDRGAKVIARALRDAGNEVIYSGLHQTAEQIVATAVDEDVAAVGLSSLSGAHLTLFPRVVRLLREAGVAETIVFGGGVIPEGDVAILKEAGLAAVFGPGTPLTTITDWVAANVPHP